MGHQLERTIVDLSYLTADGRMSVTDRRYGLRIDPGHDKSQVVDILPSHNNVMVKYARAILQGLIVTI